MKYLKSRQQFESNNSVEIRCYEDIFKYSAEEIVSSRTWNGFTWKEDAIEYLEDKISSDFPYGYANFPETFTAYRYVKLNDLSELNESELGLHYITTELPNSEFFATLGLDDHEGDLYCLTVELKKSDVDFSSTIGQNLEFPNEEEIQTNTRNPDAKILDVKKIDDIKEYIRTKFNY